ncbi:uncharacterized protein LOC126974678 [Leptidea sinapis]|uniref:uncharacterized protein LOC126974678 n=1 Tax=Leptidea sinapis TaxID=189913 RepID=UPI002125A289|nr:uncharacterized protein LOC126974678 [Leptidea sinapis]
MKLQVIEKVDKMSLYFTLLMVVCSFFGLILFNISPMWYNVANGVFKKEYRANVSVRFSIIYEYPGFKPEDYFVFVTYLNVYLSYACTISICAIDLLLCLMVFQIIGHIQILQMNLDGFSRPKNEKSAIVVYQNQSINNDKFDEEENRCIHRNLIENVEHHRFIVRTHKL